MWKRIFWLQILGLVQKLANSNERIAKKCEKPSFLGILGQKGQFWKVFGQNEQNREFKKIAIGTFLSRLQVHLTVKFQKSNERILRYPVTDGRRNERTDGRESLGQCHNQIVLFFCCVHISSQSNWGGVAQMKLKFRKC